MDKLKVMTIIGTRPEIIRLSEIIKVFDDCFSHILVHTGQNWDYELNKVFFENLEIREPDYYLDAVGKNLGMTMGNIVSKSFDVFEKEKPDALLVLGDTNSSLSVLSAKRLKIPIFHMEAGNRCFDQNVPEEINRKIIDHVSDVNLPYTEHARRYLISEGVKKEHIFVTGSPMAEVFQKNLKKIKNSKILNSLKLKAGKYILISAHREENIDNEDSFFSLMNSFNDVAKKYKLPIVYSVHPRSWKKIEERNFKFHPLIKKIKPLGFFDYNHLQLNSFCVLSDSGTLSEESTMLNFPGVLIRTSTERPEVLDKGIIVIGGIDGKNIIQSIELTRELWGRGEKRSLVPSYMDNNVSVKIAKIIQSYTEIVNQRIWRKKQI